MTDLLRGAQVSKVITSHTNTMRTNGFQNPTNGMQVTTWILFPFLFAHFFLFLTPTLPIYISIPATIFFAVSGLLGLYFGYITTKTDPIDTKLYYHLHGQKHPLVLKKEKAEDKKKLKRKKSDKQPSSLIAVVGSTSTDEGGIEAKKPHSEESGLNEVEEKTKYCWVCQTDVFENSMHCKYCNKCVGTFDHHCMWLNNCIGEANYKYFFRTVVFLFLFSMVHAGSLIFYLSMYFGGHEATRTLSNNWLNSGVPEIVVGFNIGFLVLTFAIAVLVVQLLTFHMNLRRESITTYQYIIRDGQQKREEWHVDQKVKQKRGQVVKTLTQDGRWIQAYWLKLGAKVCTPCDPIKPMVKKEIEEAAAAAASAEEGEVDNEDSSGGSPREDEKKSERDSIRLD